MATIDLTNGQLVVGITGLDRFFTFKSQLTVPLEHVADASSAQTEARNWYKGLRLGGTNVPGLLTAGTFYHHNGWVFWDVRDPALAIAVDLHDEKYRRFIVQVDDPAATIAAIEAAVAQAQPAAPVTSA